MSIDRMLVLALLLRMFEMDLLSRRCDRSMCSRWCQLVGSMMDRMKLG